VYVCVSLVSVDEWPNKVGEVWSDSILEAVSKSSRGIFLYEAAAAASATAEQDGTQRDATQPQQRK